MLTEKDYCDYETCVALKELGLNNVAEARLSISAKVFDLKPEPYIELSPKILLYEAQKWLREEKKIEANASFDKEDDGWIAFIQRLDYPDLCGTDVFSTVYNTYESALLVSIKEAVKILKEK